MSRVPIEKTAMRIDAATGRFVTVEEPDSALWVLERRHRNRTIDPLDVEATETVIPIYDSPIGGEPVAQPVFAEDSHYKYYREANAAGDYYMPHDPVDPIQPFGEAGLGRRPQRGNFDLTAGFRRVRFASFYHNASEEFVGLLIGSRLIKVEYGDPCEDHTRHTPGDFNTKTPPTTHVAEGFSSSDPMDVFVANGSKFADDLTKYDGLGGTTEFVIDGQPVTYDHVRTISGELCGDHDAGETTVIFAKNPTTDPFPVGPGRVRCGRDKPILQYENTETLLTTQTNGTELAGSVVLTLDSVAGLPAEGAIAANYAGGRVINYDSIIGNELQLSRPLDRLTPDNTVVTVYQFTGVTTIRQAVVDEDHFEGDEILFLAGHSMSFGESGTITIEGLGDVDFTSVEWGEFMLAQPLPFDIPDGTVATMTTIIGLSVDRDNESEVACEVLENVTGLTGDVDIGAVVEYDPRINAVTPKDTGVGFRSFDAASVGGYAGTSVKESAQTVEDFLTANQYPMNSRRTIATQGPKSIERLMFLETDHGIGVGELSVSELEHLFQIAGPRCYVASPGQIMGDTLFVDSARQCMPDAGTIQINVINNANGGAQETREFTYNGIGDRYDELQNVAYDGTGGYVIGDFWVSGGGTVRLAATFRFASLGLHTGLLLDKDRPSETYIGVGVGPDDEPGIEIGQTDKSKLWQDADLDLVSTEGSVEGKILTEATWRPVHRSAVRLRSQDIGSAAIWIPSIQGGPAQEGTTGPQWFPFSLNDNDWDPFTNLKMRLVCSVLVNETGPGRDILAQLYPVGTPAGASNILDLNLGSPIADSDVTFTSAELTPPGGGVGVKITGRSSDEFDFPADGLYVVAFDLAGSFTTNSFCNVSFRLDVRGVL